MKVLKIIGLVIAVLIALYLVLALMAPKSFHVERKISINCRPETVFGAVNNFKEWEKWGPWITQDSTIKNTYSGPEWGVGSKTTWTSKKSGTGSMEIMVSQPAKHIGTQVRIGNMNPFEGSFTFVPADSATEVTWTSDGNNGFLWRPFNFFADHMMGPDFELGLTRLKNYVESMPKWRLGEYKIEELPAITILSMMDSCRVEEIGAKLGADYGEIGGVMKKNKLDFVGPVMAYYHAFSPENVVLEPAVPVSKEVKGEGRVKGKTVPKTKVLTVSFFGDYPLMMEAMPSIKKYMKDNNLEIVGPEREAYVTDPTTVKDKMQIETVISFPIK